MEKLPSLTAATNFLEAHYRRAEALVDAEGLRWLQHKRRHTYAVLAAAERIVAGEPELAAASATEKRSWQLAALFHDLGRADEIAAQGKLEVGKRRFDHAAASWEALRARPDYSGMPEVLLAAKHHSWVDLSRLETDPDYLAAPPGARPKILTAAKLVRDADKLANLEFLAFDGLGVLFGADQAPARGPLSPGVAERMALRQPVLLAERETLSDCVAFFAGWWFDLNFSTTKKALLAAGLPAAVGRALEAAGHFGDGTALAKKWFDLA